MLSRYKPTFELDTAIQPETPKAASQGQIKGLFTRGVCINVCIKFCIKWMVIQTLIQRMGLIHFQCLHLRHHWHNIKVDADVDADAHITLCVNKAYSKQKRFLGNKKFGYIIINL